MSISQKIVGVGVGPVALPSYIELLKRGHSVHAIAKDSPHDGYSLATMTANDAAGIVCRFNPSNKYVADAGAETYSHTMKIARDSKSRAVRETKLFIEKSGNEVDYRDLVEGFTDVSETRAHYTTATFNPMQWGIERLAEFKELGGTFEQRPLMAEEMARLRSGEGLKGFDYTYATMGLHLRDAIPEVQTYPIGGVLVHFPEIEDTTSYMDEPNAHYVISRMGGVVLGGTFHEHVGQYSDQQLQEIGQSIVDTCNRTWGLKYDFNKRVRITAGSRPGIVGGAPAIKFGEKVGYVTGLGGQGWVTWYTIKERVANSIEEQLAS